MSARVEPPSIAQYGAALEQERATSTARQCAARLAMEQLEFRAGKRKRAWEGGYLNRLLIAATSDRDGCLTCGGRGWIVGGVTEAMYPEQCSDCDPQAPGFAPAEATDES